jgi:uncharacterized protein
MKYLLLIALVVVAWLIWRNGRLRDERETRASAKPPPPAGDPQEMVSCPVCGIHLPRSEAVPGQSGLLYCSNEHRLRAGG